MKWWKCGLICLKPRKKPFHISLKKTFAGRETSPMPELPEVETIKRITEPQIRGQRILSAEVRNAQIIAYPDKNSFCEKIQGMIIKAGQIRRRGHCIVLAFSSHARRLEMFRICQSTEACIPSRKARIYIGSEGDPARNADTDESPLQSKSASATTDRPSNRQLQPT